MRWFHSIITKITLIFILAIIGIGAILFIFLNHEKQKELSNMEQFTRYAIHSSHDAQTKELDIKNLENFGLTLVTDEKLKQKLLTKNIFEEKQGVPQIQKGTRGMMRFIIKAIAYERKIYVLVKLRGTDFVFLTQFKKEIFPTLLFPLVAISLVILLYIAIIRSILPLYDLRKKVKMFADGDYNFECTQKNKDEIGALANEFNNAVQKIKKLRDSRQLFLRNIMHELKTPITKGKFLSELIEDKNYQSSLENIFRRQEDLLEEFSRIEKLSADELPLNLRTYQFEDILDFSLDILNHDDSQVLKEVAPMIIEADFELFGTAIKNLLDNGIKYSKDGKVSIKNSAREIVITNVAQPLEFPLDMYAQAYFLEGKKQKSSLGLGFGLFIVLNIIKLHNMKISYIHEDGRNIFTIQTQSS